MELACGMGWRGAGAGMSGHERGWLSRMRHAMLPIAGPCRLSCNLTHVHPLPQPSPLQRQRRAAGRW